MDPEIIILSEAHEEEQDNVWHHLHVESKKRYKWIYL